MRMAELTIYFVIPTTKNLPIAWMKFARNFLCYIMSLVSTAP